MGCVAGCCVCVNVIVWRLCFMKSVKLCVPHVDSYISDCIQWSILIMSLIPTDNKPLHIYFIMTLKGNFHRPYFKLFCKMCV